MFCNCGVPVWRQRRTACSLNANWLRLGNGEHNPASSHGEAEAATGAVGCACLCDGSAGVGFECLGDCGGFVAALRGEAWGFGNRLTGNDKGEP
jgi:hypothetical protein